MNHTLKNETHKQLGFSYLETAEIVVKLNILLTNYQVHFHRLQNFHWNIKGPDFFVLHEKFGTINNQTFDDLNQIAERIRVFNQRPVSQMEEALKLAQLEDSFSDLSGEMMVRKILDDYQVLFSFIIEAHEIAHQNGDIGTTDLLNGLMKRMEKNHWMLNASLAQFEAAPLPNNEVF